MNRQVYQMPYIELCEEITVERGFALSNMVLRMKSIRKLSGNLICYGDEKSNICSACSTLHCIL